MTIGRALSAAGYPPPGIQQYARIEIVGDDEEFGVYYRNLDEDFIWDLTRADVERAVASIKRCDSPRYRALRRGFQALMLAALRYEYVDPYLDVIEVLEPVHGTFSIDDAGESNEFRLIWRAAENPSQPVDLSRLDPIEAARAIFGDDGAESAEKWSDFW